MIISPTDLPALRAELVRELCTDRFASSIPADGMEHPLLGVLTPRAYGELTAETLKPADLFFVASDMAELARVAARSLPPIGLDRYDPPSPTGFIVFEDGACLAPHGTPSIDYRVTAVSWFEYQGLGVLVERYAERDHMLDAFVHAGVASREDAAYSRSVMPRLPLMGAGCSWIPYGATDADENSGRFLELDRIIRSAWLLMQQPVATVSDAEYKRADRRRLERQQINLDRVRVITLRRASHSSDSGESDREYHHQWIVRGHWRQQWYPSRGVHRPVWIAPHIKGPEGAPLLGGEKVHAWTR